jgi:hypothetical protein
MLIIRKATFLKSINSHHSYIIKKALNINLNRKSCFIIKSHSVGLSSQATTSSLLLLRKLSKNVNDNNQTLVKFSNSSEPKNDSIFKTVKRHLSEAASTINVSDKASSATETTNTPHHTLPKSTKVVICGGGLFGTSIAYHLAQIGYKDVVLLTKDK